MSSVAASSASPSGKSTVVCFGRGRAQSHGALGLRATSNDGIGQALRKESRLGCPLLIWPAAVAVPWPCESVARAGGRSGEAAARVVDLEIHDASTQLSQLPASSLEIHDTST